MKAKASSGCGLTIAGSDLAAAVAGAKKYVHDAIAAAYWVGGDCGVLGFVQGSGG